MSDAVGAAVVAVWMQYLQRQVFLPGYRWQYFLHFSIVGLLTVNLLPISAFPIANMIGSISSRR